MAKRKSRTTAEFKAPKRMQHRAKRQKSTEETNHSEDEDQTPESDNTHNASCSDKLDEHQPGQSTLQVTQTTEIPVDPCSLEDKTSHDDNDELGNPPEVSREIEQTAAITLQTPELDNSDALCRPVNTETINTDLPKLDDEEGEITRSSNDQMPDSELPADERELSHEENTDAEPQTDEQLGSSGTSYEQVPEDTGSADPLVKRKVRKRMGMCRFGDRKKMSKGQSTTDDVSEGRRENETEQITNEDVVMMSGEKGVIELLPSVSTSCPPVQEEQEQSDGKYGNEVQTLVKCMEKEPVTNETNNAIPSYPEDLNPLEQYDTECTEQNATESNIREDSNGATTEVPVDFTEVCKDPADVSAQEEAVIASASTSEVANPFGEEVVVGSERIDQCSPCECDMNTSPSDHTSVELVDITSLENIRAPPAIHEMENKSSDFSQVATTITAKSKADCENSSMSLPAAPPAGDTEDVESFTEHVGLVSDGPEPGPSSPLSMHSVTDSQLNNIPLSLEDLPISEASCDLEDATELVCSLIRDIASLNQLLMDARRKIGQQGRKPPLHTQKYKHSANRF